MLSAPATAARDALQEVVDSELPAQAGLHTLEP